MKASELFNGLDEYARKARALPGLVAALPILSFVVVLVPHQPLFALMPVAASAGVAFLLASVVRARGRALEQQLVKRWDGLPTTHMLRFQEAQNSVIFDRRRRALEALLGERLPTRRQESTNSVRADDAYVAATRFLIARVRDRSIDFPRVHEENVAYGFARNSLGLKYVAVGVALLAIAADCVMIVVKGLEPNVLIVLPIHLLLLAYWLFFVKESWVYQAGVTYAERLFEALDSPLLAEPPRAVSNVTTS